MWLAETSWSWGYKVECKLNTGKVQQVRLPLWRKKQFIIKQQMVPWPSLEGTFEQGSKNVIAIECSWILIIILSIWYSHILISEHRAQWQALSPNLLVPPRFYNWACSIKSEIDSWFIQIFNIYNVNHPDTWCLWKKCLSQIIKVRLANHFMGFKTSVTSLKISCRVSLHNEHISTPGQTQK